MPDQRIDQLNAETTPAAADVLPVYSIAGSDTKKITVKNLVQQGAALVDDASIPVAKVNLSGISGTNLSAGTVAASKLDTSTIPATGGVTVSSSNLQLVAPTSPIVRNAGTGSLEHAVSGVTAGTYTKVTVDSKGHVTVGAAVAAADLPIAISGTVGVMSPGTGLSVTGGGVLNHSSSVTAGTTSGFTYNAQGHITGAVALAGADLPISTSSVIGAVRPGTGLSVDGNGILDVTAATNAVLGGVIAGSDFSVTTGTISLAAQAGIAAGTYTKLTVNSKGIATAGTVLSAGDIPNIATSQITSGTLSIDRYGANTITGAKLANYSISKISDAFPTADYISQLYFSPLEKTLYMWDGNVYQPIGVSYGQVVFSGTYDAGTNLIASVTTEGAAIGLTVGGALVSPVTATKGHYVVVDQPGTGTAPAPTISLSPPDMLLSNGTTWVLLDVSDTVTAQLASNIQVSPAGNISTTNVQSALQELDDEKLAKAGGTLTGNLALNTGIAIVYEGATTDDFETTLYVVDPTADRTILLPNVSGTVVTTGDTGTVTSTMLLDGTILNEDINASAAIVDTKLATIATGGKVSGTAITSGNISTSGSFTSTSTVTGTNLIPTGSGVPTNGIYLPAANSVAVATNGTGRLFVDASGNISNVRSTATAFSGTDAATWANGLTLVNTATPGTGVSSFISFQGISVVNSVFGVTQGGSGYGDFVWAGYAGSSSERMRLTAGGLLGIGTSSPGATLDVTGSTYPNFLANRSLSSGGSGAAAWTAARVQATTTEQMSAGFGVQQEFVLRDADAVDNTVASILVSRDGADNSGSFAIRTASAGTLGTGLHVTSGGLVGIGTTSPETPLQIVSSGTAGAIVAAFDATASRAYYQVGGTTSTLYTQIGVNTSTTFINDFFGNGIAFQLAASEKARIDSSGRLLVGTSTALSNIASATPQQQIITAVDTSNTGLALINYSAAGVEPKLTLGTSQSATKGTNALLTSGNRMGAIDFAGNDGTNFIIGAKIEASLDGTSGTNDMPGKLVFFTTPDASATPTERMRITNGGDFYFNTTVATKTTDGFRVESGGIPSVSRGAYGTFMQFYNSGDGSSIGTIINTAGTATAYNTTSDYRLKENIAPLVGAINRINNLQVRRFNFIANPDHIVDGFIAHEAQAIVPECVTGTKDEVDADGNPVYQGIDQSKLVPLLTAALQEAIAKIENLEARLTAAGID